VCEERCGRSDKYRRVQVKNPAYGAIGRWSVARLQLHECLLPHHPHFGGRVRIRGLQGGREEGTSRLFTYTYQLVSFGACVADGARVRTDAVAPPVIQSVRFDLPCREPATAAIAGAAANTPILTNAHLRRHAPAGEQIGH
jgi:hypothetical protein